MRLAALINNLKVLSVFLSSINNMMFAFHASALKCSYGALYQALNSPANKERASGCFG